MSQNIFAQVLERLKANQRRDYMKGTVSGSVQVHTYLIDTNRRKIKSKSRKVGFIKNINAGNRSTDEGAARHLQESKFQIWRLSGVKKASALLQVV